MWKLDKEQLKKQLLYALAVLGAYLAQAVVFPWFPIRGVRPLVLICSLMAIVVFEGPLTGGAWGLVIGVLCDASMNQPSFYFTLLCPAVAIAAGFLADAYLSRGFPSCLVLSAGSLLLCGILQVLRPVLFGGCSLSSACVMCLVQTLYSLVFCVPCYLAVRKAFRTAK